MPQNPYLTQLDQTPRNGLLTRSKYDNIKKRLLQGLAISACEESSFIHTVLAIEALVLFGGLYKERVTTGGDVALIGEDLARRFCDDGYSFALYKLFEAAGYKVCYKGTHHRVRDVVEIAFKEIQTSRRHDAEVYTYFAVSPSQIMRKFEEAKLTLKGLKALITSYGFIVQNRI